MLDSSEPDIQPDFDKFRAVVHHICARCTDVDRLGRTKLHKILYYSDMLRFLETGKPLTGVDYIKQPFGPTARPLGRTLRDLETNGEIAIRQRPYFGMTKYDFISLRAPASNLIGESETALLGEVMDFVCNITANEISEISHAKPWESVGIGDRIPYYTAAWLIPEMGISEEQERLVEQEVRRLRFNP